MNKENGTYTPITAEGKKGESEQRSSRLAPSPRVTDEMRAVFWSIFRPEVEHSESYERAKQLYPEIAHLLR
jgi:hypothetical protein